MRNSSFTIGMSKRDSDIYSIAHYVGMPVDRIEPFLKVLAMCGYELRGPEGSAPSADAQDAGAVTAQADPHQYAAPQPLTAKPEPELSQESLGRGDAADAAPNGDDLGR